MSPLRINGKLATKAQLTALDKKAKAAARLEKQRRARGWYDEQITTDFGTPPLLGDGPTVYTKLVPPPRKPRQKSPPKPRANPACPPVIDQPVIDFSKE
jgi:hypothetical protein